MVVFKVFHLLVNTFSTSREQNVTEEEYTRRQPYQCGRAIPYILSKNCSKTIVHFLQLLPDFLFRYLNIFKNYSVRSYEYADFLYAYLKIVLNIKIVRDEVAN